MHSCHTALSNYSTIAATQVMEFQLKYDSFRICFCSRAREPRYVWWIGGGLGWGGLYSLSTHLPARSPRRSPSKGNDLAETLLFRGTLWLEPAAGQKWGVVIKVFETKSQKWKALADRLFPGTITLPAVPNIRVQEISAREGVLSSDWWLARKLVKSYVYMTLRGCKLFQA